ncbi:MAG: phosphoserine aminotransferase apoenzyme [Alphaproteobacteria bacterium]|nr:phosphoserine aminotransferase apoenzyme [Alphaproteobacteria bacterium]
MATKPLMLPKNASFSSGPCAKRPGWAFGNLDTELLGRSHRSGPAKKKLKELVDLTHRLLGIPADYKIGITPASDTGAVELAMWNLLGAPGIGVDVFAWEQFSWLWLNDIMTELRLPDARAFEAPYGELPDLNMMQPNRDAVFAWNGTTSGARIPDGDAIPAGDKGLRICDATSGVFAYDILWEKLDVVTWSWQKSMGGEAQHGMIVMSPKALQRLQEYRPSWPMPKIFQLRDENGINWPFFDGVTINTPSMMCVADALDSLRWMESIGGLDEVHARINRNAGAVEDWLSQHKSWIDYLPHDPAIRSKTSICLQFVDTAFTGLPAEQQQKKVDKIVSMLEQEKAAYDIKSYKTAPLGLRIWCGGTVDTDNIQAMLPWIEWAYNEVMQG